MNAFAGTQDTLPASLWAATAIEAPPTPRAEGRQKADVAIVGGGYLGLTTALALAEAGTDVIVLEAAEPGWGASGRNGGQVIPGLKLDPDELVQQFGAERGGRMVAFAGSAPDVVFSNIVRYGIDCQPVRNGWIQPAHSDTSRALLERRCAAWQRHGADVDLLSADETARLIGTNVYCGGWIDRRGGGIQPLSYARGIAKAAIAAGVRLHGRSKVDAITRTGRQWRVQTDAAEIVADQVLICTNAYSGRLGGDLQRTVIAPNSFQIATRPLSDNIRRTMLPEGHVASDARRLLLYYRIDHTGRLLVGGRGSFRNPSHPDHFKHLKRALAALFPQAADSEIDYYWSGRVAITLDHMPHLHQLGPGLVAALGCNGRGVALTSATGRVLAQWFRDHRDDELPLPFTRARKVPFHELQELYVAAASSWYRLRDWMT